jgi:hypothetical protein
MEDSNNTAFRSALQAWCRAQLSGNFPKETEAYRFGPSLPGLI